MGYMTGVVVAGMLFFGTCTVVIQKLILSMWGYGKDGVYHQFKKPWFQTEAMFIGMFGCLVVYEVMRCVQRAKAKKNAHLSENQPLVNSEEEGKKAKPEIPVWKQYCLVCLPALCDMCATAMMNIGLLWIAPSVWQMLRGSMVIFSACFSKFFLHRNLHASHWTGVGLVAFSLVVVAFAALMQPPRPKLFPSSSSSESSSSSFGSSESISSGSGEDDDTVTTGQVALGCALVVLAQIIQASQIVIEEHLLKNICLHPVLVVGLEGMWGTLSCSILLCFTSFIPLKYGGEDAIDTLIMFFTNGNILGFGIFYALVILCYNLFGMFVTSYTSAVLRTILEGLRCACIWIVNMIIYYSYISVNHKDTDFGEFWNDWSYLQFCGFLFLLLGMFVYNGIVRIEGLYYESNDPFVCDISSKMGSNPDLAVFAKDKKFLGEMAEFQGRDKAMAIKERLLTVPGMDDVKLQTLEAMVGITPRMLDGARVKWQEAETKKNTSDSVVEVTSA